MAEPDASKAKALCEADTEEEAPAPSQDTNQQSEQDYDFVEEPDQDYFCPVSLELLEEPCQTSCCGHHISEQAANRLVKGGKPCPMCKQETYTCQQDKYFKRKVRQLKVHCTHKKNGCEWVGELGDLDHHTESCPKRPWKCQHCEFKSTYDTGTNEHTPKCAKYPLPCGNQCGIGILPRCDVEKHEMVCPLQLVECEFAHAGCDVKVPRRDLTKHMTESAQHHLMSATLLNLQLTRELYQRMKEKDQQIADLKEQLRELSEDTKQRLTKQEEKMDGISQQQENHQTKILSTITSLALVDYTCDEITLSEFSRQQAKGDEGNWLSEPVYSPSKGIGSVSQFIVLQRDTNFSST